MFHQHQFGPPKNSSGATSSGAIDVIAIDHVLFLSHVLLHVLVCLLVEFDLLFAFGVLACRILDCASLLCGVLSGKLSCLRLKLELLAFGIRKLIDVNLLRF